MNGYIEEGAWASCSFDLAGAPQQLQRRFEPGESFSVGYASGKRLLTVEDKNTKEKFICKLPAKMWGGLIALVGGMVGGLIIVASGPVGWALVGAFAAATVAAAVGGAIGGYAIASFCHDCAGPQSDGSWRSHKTKVLIKGEKPILYNKSVLECANGGLLIASESKQEAQEVSDAMKWQAQGELGLQVLSNALIGVYTGYEFKDGSGASLDLDISSIPLGIGSYYVTDITRATAGDSPGESAGIGSVYTITNFILGGIQHIPGMPTWTKHLGTEVFDSDLGYKNPKAYKDLIWAGIMTLVGASSDFGEAALSESTEDVITDIEDSKIDFSGKSVVATGYK